jgi:uncharacterized protein (UPF0276 family)
VSYIGLNYEPPLHGLIADAIAERLLTAIEIIPDPYMFDRARELRDIVRGFAVPYTFHFISNSLGSADFDRNNDVDVFARVMSRLEPVHYSDHLTCCRIGNVDLMQNIAVPRTPEMVDLFVANIRLLERRFRGRRRPPFLIENLTCGIEYEDSTLAPAEFYRAIAERSDSYFLLDVHNLYVDEINLGLDAMKFIASIPAERIREVHVAGGSWAQSKRTYLDSHDQRTPSRVLELLDAVLARANPTIIVLERQSEDMDISVVRRDILDDLADIHRIHGSWTKRRDSASQPSSLPA